MSVKAATIQVYNGELTKIYIPGYIQVVPLSEKPILKRVK